VKNLIEQEIRMFLGSIVVTGYGLTADVTVPLCVITIFVKIATKATSTFVGLDQLFSTFLILSLKKWHLSQLRHRTTTKSNVVRAINN
jgi:hypothetical protein